MITLSKPQVEPESKPKNVRSESWKRFLLSSGTRSETLFFIFVMGVTIGLIGRTFYDPFWLQSPEAIYVHFGMSIVMACSAKLIALRVMMFMTEIEDA